METSGGLFDCQRKFDENPAHYTGDERQGGLPDVETHEPPHLKIAGVPLPKFGSAGGGGLEREPGPETHVKHRKP